MSQALGGSGRFITARDGVAPLHEYAMAKVWAETLGDMYARVHGRQAGPGRAHTVELASLPAHGRGGGRGREEGGSLAPLEIHSGVHTFCVQCQWGCAPRAI